MLSGLELDEDSTRLSITLATSTLPAPNISYTVNFALRDGEADNGVCVLTDSGIVRTSYRPVSVDVAVCIVSSVYALPRYVY